MGENIDENELDEWKKIRELVSSYDDRKHELRKTGFSLITALIAAQSILFITIANSSSTIRDIATNTTIGNYITQSLTNLAYNPDIYNIFNILNINKIYINDIGQAIKAVAILVTIALIFAVIYYEKGYRFYQQAAVQRALILEKKLNLQLTETISYQFGSHSSRLYESGVYFLFIGSALLLSSIVTPLYFPLLLVITGLAIFFTLILTRNVKDNYKLCVGLKVKIEIWLRRFWAWIWGQKRIESPHLDWSVDPLICKPGDKVAVTLTNLNMDESILKFDSQTLTLKKGLKRKDEDNVVFIKRENSFSRALRCFFICDLKLLKNLKQSNENSDGKNILFKIVTEDACQKYECNNYEKKSEEKCSETECIQDIKDRILPKTTKKKVSLNKRKNKEPVFERNIPNGFQIKAGASYTWLWDTTKIETGIYAIYTPYNTPEILTRKIRII